MPFHDQKRYGELHVADAPLPALHLRALLCAFSEGDESRARLLAGTGIEAAALPGAGTEIRVWQQLRFVDNLTRWRPGWGAQVPSVPLGCAHESVTVACRSAPTLSDSLGVIERYGSLWAPYLRLRLSRSDALVELRLEPLVDLISPGRRPLLETVLRGLQAMIEAAMQRWLTGGLFFIAGPRTPLTDTYGSLFHAPVRCDAETTGVAIPAAWRTRDNPLADVETHTDALASLEAAERRFRSASGVVREVERLLRAAHEEPSLSRVAAELGVSRRTLERLLKDSSTSYRRIVDQHRRERASSLLRNGALSIAEAAYRVGFADPANFTRACRRWFGSSPSDYRSHHAGLRAVGERGERHPAALVE